MKPSLIDLDRSRFFVEAVERKFEHAKNCFWKKLCAGSLASLIIVLGSTAGQSQSVSKSGIDHEQLAKIPLQFKSFVERGAMAGAVMLIARRGAVVSLEAIGYQDLESKKPMRVDTIFDIRSVTGA